MENVIITNQEKFEKIKTEMKKGGVLALHVLADFDRTLIKAFVNGKSVPSIMSILRDGNYLTLDYTQKAHGLFNKYRPIELDPNIPAEEKKKAMQEWWTTHFELIIKSGLTKKEVEAAMQSTSIQFRDGFSKFIDFLKEKNIPLAIMSSSGLGVEAIKMCLAREGKLYKNVFVISNAFEWDENGNAVAIKQPIIHSLNKDETLIKYFPEIFKAIKDRKNVLLLGDSLDDIKAIEGFEYENLIKIGFLNENIEENLEHYKEAFDVVILNDGSMDFVNNLIGDIVKNSI